METKIIEFCSALRVNVYLFKKKRSFYFVVMSLRFKCKVATKCIFLSATI